MVWKREGCILAVLMWLSGLTEMFESEIVPEVG